VYQGHFVPFIFLFICKGGLWKHVAFQAWVLGEHFLPLVVLFLCPCSSCVYVCMVLCFYAHHCILFCHNPSLGLATKARACKVAGQEGSLGVTSCAPGSAKECEGMNPHTPKWTPIVGELESQMDSQIFIQRLQGSKPIILNNFLYHSKTLRM
jgi:hypothetical protein